MDTLDENFDPGEKTLDTTAETLDTGEKNTHSGGGGKIHSGGNSDTIYENQTPERNK